MRVRDSEPFCLDPSLQPDVKGTAQHIVNLALVVPKLVAVP